MMTLCETDEQTLNAQLSQLCKEAHYVKFNVAFEPIYSTIYHMCLKKEYDVVHTCLLRAIERIHNGDSLEAERKIKLLDAVSLYYNNTCTMLGLPMLLSMYENYKSRPSRFTTPPPTP